MNNITMGLLALLMIAATNIYCIRKFSKIEAKQRILQEQINRASRSLKSVSFTEALNFPGSRWAHSTPAIFEGEADIIFKGRIMSVGCILSTTRLSSGAVIGYVIIQNTTYAVTVGGALAKARVISAKIRRA